MKDKAISVVARNPRLILFVVFAVMLLVGSVGEVAAHNPGGQEVPVCGHDHPGHNHYLPDLIC